MRSVEFHIAQDSAVLYLFGKSLFLRINIEFPSFTKKIFSQKKKSYALTFSYFSFLQ